jgi:hypothetical protein
MVAWDYLRGKNVYNGPTPYPTEDMRWGLAGTANAVSWMHIDSDGFATFIRIMTGKKVWAIYRPLSSGLPLSSTKIFLRDSFCLTEVPTQEEFNMEAMVLRQGDLLYVVHGYLVIDVRNDSSD